MKMSCKTNKIIQCIKPAIPSASLMALLGGLIIFEGRLPWGLNVGHQKYVVGIALIVGALVMIAVAYMHNTKRHNSDEEDG